jgi:hypothetical protein
MFSLAALSDIGKHSFVWQIAKSYRMFIIFKHIILIPKIKIIFIGLEVHLLCLLLVRVKLFILN